MLDEDVYRLAFAIGGTQAYRDYVAGVPIARGAGTLVGRVGLERRTVQILDVLADPDYEMHRARELGGFRTMLGVPMLAGEKVIGVITAVARAGRGVRRAHARSHHDLRRPGRDRDPERAAVPRARGRGPPQVGVPGLDVARAANAAERRDRVLRRAARADVRRAQRAPGGVRPRHPRLRAPPARADQRDPRPLEGRGGADGARAGAPCRCPTCSSTGWRWCASGRRSTGSRSRSTSRRRSA